MDQNIIYIDEELMARNLFPRRLQRYLNDEVKVISIDPLSDIDEMVEFIENYDSLISVIVDQRLNVAGTASYLGTELVRKLRLVDQLMPIYILTNFVEDIDPSLGSVEYILNKDDFLTEDKLRSISERITRHVNIFNSILDERERRFEELLRKRFESPLSEEESKEFSLLKYSREKKSLASTFIDCDELTRKIEMAEAKLKEIENKIKE